MNATARCATRTSLVLALALASAPRVTLAATEAPTRATEQYNVSKSGPALGGYDPVSYFPDGGSKPLKGEARLSHTDRGITYRFASQHNLDLFKANPDAYIPAHGGWCSWAMAQDGSKVEVDPKSYIIADGRLFLFYKDLITDTRAKFQKDTASNATRADANWKRLSGEPPITGASTTIPALKPKLDEMKEKFNASAPADRKALYEDGITSVEESGVMQSALGVGAAAPDFTLTDASGNPVRLADLLAQGPVVLTWYRGGWCPYCNIQLRAYQEALPEIKAMGAQLVALSPEMPDNSLSTREKLALEFTVLSDVQSKVARDYGISYRLPDSLIEAFKGRLDLPALNGDDSWQLPLGATYVIAPDGTIAYAFVSADYRERAEPEAILQAIRALR
jgi:peroxiredoxin/YHS domain-containing protein